MDDSRQVFSHFALDSSEASAVQREFERVLPSLDLSQRAKVLSQSAEVKKALVKYKGRPGIYFWILKDGGVEYKVYIGQTQSLSARLKNYISEFQPHSPNDYKLRVFYDFALRLLPNATLDLYFSEKSKDCLGNEEKSAMEKYRPFFYKLPRPDSSEKDKLKRAFSMCCQSIFEQNLNR